jgi:hypothetical protein
MNTSLPPIIGDNQERLLAMIACIPFLFWVPIVLEKKTDYTSYFMKHGFGLTAIIFALSLSMNLLGFILIFLFPIIWLIQLCIVICAVYLGYHAFMGKKIAIPHYTENLEKILIQLGIISWFTPTK